MAYVKREANDGIVAWTNTVTPVTAYRTDLASGVTAESVAYSDAIVTLAYDTALSGINPTNSTLYVPQTAQQ